MVEGRGLEPALAKRSERWTSKVRYKSREEPSERGQLPHHPILLRVGGAEADSPRTDGAPPLRSVGMPATDDRLVEASTRSLRAVALLVTLAMPASEELEFARGRTMAREVSRVGARLLLLLPSPLLLPVGRGAALT